jgi:hypothetical protein
MTKPDKPLEAKGCGCGFIIVVVAIGYALTAVFGLSSDTSMYVAIGIAVFGIIGYYMNEAKAKRILDSEYEDAKRRETEAAGKIRDEISCASTVTQCWSSELLA